MTNSAQAPRVSINVAIGGLAGQRLGADGRGATEAAEAVGSHVANVLGELGVPASPAVEVRAVEAAATNRPLNVSVDGHHCRYPEELLWRVAAYLDGTPPRYGGLPFWESPDTRFFEFVGLACAEIVKVRPRVLLTDGVAASYLDALPPASDEGRVSDAAMTWCLRRLLDLSIGLGACDALADAARQSSDLPPPILRERLVTSLAPEAIEVCAPAALAEQLGTGRSPSSSGLLAYAADAIMEELGIVAAPFHRRHDHPTNTVAVRINSLRTLPWSMLPPGQHLVNFAHRESDESKRMGREALNPATGRPATLMPESNAAALEAQGWTKWDDAGYAILCIAEELRAHAKCLIDETKVEVMLAALTATAPKLVDEIQALVHTAFIVGVLRNLVAERVSITNLPIVLESLLDARLALGGPDANLDWETRATTHVRRGLRRELARGVTGGTRTLVAYLLDQELENALRDSTGDPAGADEAAAALVAALDAEAHQVGPNIAQAHILTLPDVRPKVRAALCDAFPRVAVIAHDELPPGWNVLPLARLRAA